MDPPVLIPQLSRPEGTLWAFEYLMVTDAQLVIRVKRRWPDLCFRRQKIAAARNERTGESLRDADCWVFSTERWNYARGRFDVRVLVRILVEENRSWMSWRWGLYCLYVSILSGGAS